MPFENRKKLDITHAIDSQQPLLIFGGCYSNVEATRVLKAWADEQGFSPEQCICTGDIVAYCGNPIETVDLIVDWGVHCIQGNVEQSLANKADDCGCGFESGSVCDVLSKGWYPYADSIVPVHHREWFKGLPENLIFQYANKTVCVVHGATSDVSRFMFNSQYQEDFEEEIALADADIVIAGHSGLPFTKMLDEKMWHNSGALGMPANDGTQRVWFSIAEKRQDALYFTHHSLEYDFQKTIETMKSNGLTQGYDQAIATGIWPSMDVLPDAEKRQQGVALML